MLSSLRAFAISCQWHLQALKDPQVELHLFRSCLSLCKMNHLLQTANRGMDQFLRFVRSCLGSIINSSLFNAAWNLATLPIRLGGVGLKESLQGCCSCLYCKLQPHVVFHHNYLDSYTLSVTDVALTESSEREQEHVSLSRPGPPNHSLNLRTANQRAISLRFYTYNELKGNASLRDSTLWQLHTCI